MGLGVWGRIHHGFEAQDRIGKVVKVGRQHVHITTFQLGTGKHDTLKSTDNGMGRIHDVYERMTLCIHLFEKPKVWIF